MRGHIFCSLVKKAYYNRLFHELEEIFFNFVNENLAQNATSLKSVSYIHTTDHAIAWSYKEYSKMAMGERIQVDHMTVSKNGISVKHFQAWDRPSKYIHAQLYGNATSRSAKKFLLELLDNLPFPILSIQVDGRSEFMGEFEAACADLGIELIVLPPASPDKNGGTERGNRVFREELFALPILSDSLGGFRNDLRAALNKYNTYRPHGALDGLTTMKYISKNNLEAAA